MRIDLNSPAMAQLDRSDGSAATKTYAGKSEPTVANSGSDVAQLATGSDAIHSLKAQLESVGDIRQDKVEQLRQAIGAGTYKICPNVIADKMLADPMLSHS